MWPGRSRLPTTGASTWCSTSTRTRGACTRPPRREPHARRAPKRRSAGTAHRNGRRSPTAAEQKAGTADPKPDFAEPLQLYPLPSNALLSQYVHDSNLVFAPHNYAESINDILTVEQTFAVDQQGADALGAALRAGAAVAHRRSRGGGAAHGRRRPHPDGCLHRRGLEARGLLSVLDYPTVISTAPRWVNVRVRSAAPASHFSSTSAPDAFTLGRSVPEG